ncbi:MAG TPA: hypothetical protein VLE27_00450 [Thermoanaerobaculia bacterium]|nr:hypothetical protein [Thermoanaerobaculia bacterium]
MFRSTLAGIALAFLTASAAAAHQPWGPPGPADPVGPGVYRLAEGAGSMALERAGAVLEARVSEPS